MPKSFRASWYAAILWLLSLGLFLETAAAVEPGPADADAPAQFSTTPSGLKYKVLRKGTGEKPKAGNTVTVHYRGWLDDGKEFDSSYKRGQPLSFSSQSCDPRLDRRHAAGGQGRHDRAGDPLRTRVWGSRGGRCDPPQRQAALPGGTDRREIIPQRNAIGENPASRAWSNLHRLDRRQGCSPGWFGSLLRSFSSSTT